MKEALSFLVLIAAFFANPLLSIAQIPLSTNATPIALFVNGTVGYGGSYGVGAGIGPSGDNIVNLPCGFTVLYEIGTSANDIRLSGQAHYSYSSTYYAPTVDYPYFKYFFPTDYNTPFIQLSEIPAGSRPTGLNYFRITIAPDYGASALPLFRSITISPQPLVNKLLNSGDIMGQGPISSTPYYNWVVEVRYASSL